MYHQAPEMDNDFIRAWTLIHELSEQLAHNQKMISTLASQAGLLQVRIIEDRSLCCAAELYPSIRRLKLGISRHRDSTYADSTQTSPKVCVVLSPYDHPPCAIRSVLTRSCNRKVRIGA